ncbi:hypothetical protein GCM10012275_14970 [Longimycelium tulufanense]|uniref:Uncharacterized protein n=1 Tax=Longimycelium tulufanense TaxID=907463 RepID=A0A8J3FTD0_9PSEU|nr:hypothetical protein [Longimycelium tulufanense]GGM44955.1 hypothetical protein GCM10012275_14970 [Longimycelium tulufanense]
MHPDLEQRLTLMPRRLRNRHSDDVRILETMLAPGERVRALTAGPLVGRGRVLFAVTDRRILLAGSGWSESLPYWQLAGVTAGRGFPLSTTLVIHTAGRVLELRSPRQAVAELVAAVRYASGVPEI